ncbi:hypothetical protein M3202_21350 [Alkalihalobacillus oceani]|uniref:Uncharacterized protein n=1 Tax=Halalkalibacter oceani TaxID=1653776 RepID=A0A9X2DTA9_9BACI|nr:hypothetical protein [Halalkalibacter oceani]MCM3716594.1 hypothetical protein [Halalkalibacter oceani]
MKQLKQLFRERKVARLMKDIEEDGERVAKAFNMVAFRFIEGRVSEIQSNFYNSAYDHRVQRCYIRHVPPITIDALIKELKELSHKTKAIQLEFDEYNRGNNVEIALYDLHSEGNSLQIFELSESPCSVPLSQRFYSEFIAKLRKIAG